MAVDDEVVQNYMEMGRAEGRGAGAGGTGAGTEGGGGAGERPEQEKQQQQPQEQQQQQRGSSGSERDARDVVWGSEGRVLVVRDRAETLSVRLDATRGFGALPELTAQHARSQAARGQGGEEEESAPARAFEQPDLQGECQMCPYCR